MDRTKPGGRIVGIDLIPAAPPRGVSTIQGNFLAPAVQELVKEYLAEMEERRRNSPNAATAEALLETDGDDDDGSDEIFITERPSYIDAERAESASIGHGHEQVSEDEQRLVDVCIRSTAELSFLF